MQSKTTCILLTVYFKEVQCSAVICIALKFYPLHSEVLDCLLHSALGLLLTRCSAVQYFHRGAKWCAGGLVISAQVTKGPTIPPNLRLYFRPSKKLKLKLIISVEVSNESKKKIQIKTKTLSAK